MVLHLFVAHLELQVLPAESACRKFHRYCVEMGMHMSIHVSCELPRLWCSEVRRQTCDLIELMETAQPIAHYYLFMEDDFRSGICPPHISLLDSAIMAVMQTWLVESS